jgi:DNA-binding GntR family transcriptional regulator
MRGNKVKYYTKNDVVYQQLKEKIVNKVLRPGERIVISDIANELEVSPMPVREAIKRLQQDGFVEVNPHVGARVAMFGTTGFKEIALIRIELEVLATRLATPYFDDDRIKELESVLKQMETAVADRDGNSYSKLNKDFHCTVYSTGPYKYLYELILNLWAKSNFSKSIFLTVPEQVSVSLDGHRKWLDALRAKDADMAAEMLRSHKTEAFQELFKEYEK